MNDEDDIFAQLIEEMKGRRDHIVLQEDKESSELIDRVVDATKNFYLDVAEDVMQELIGDMMTAAKGGRTSVTSTKSYSPIVLELISHHDLMKAFDVSSMRNDMKVNEVFIVVSWKDAFMRNIRS